MNIVLFLGFNSTEIVELLHKPNIKKVIVFDNSYENRENFENLYKQYKSHDAQLTMYEGCIERNLEAYLQKHEVDDDKYIYSGNITLLYSCKNNNPTEIHYSCSNQDKIQL
jgi:hypothetical protein